jgi:hypothetical protein
VKTFLKTVLAPAVVAFCFWRFGFAGAIWPAHPVLAGCIAFLVSSMLVQLLWPDSGSSEKAKKKDASAT